MKKIWVIGSCLLISLSSYAQNQITLRAGDSYTVRPSRHAMVVRCEGATPYNMVDCYCKSGNGPWGGIQLFKKVTDLNTGRVISDSLIQQYDGTTAGERECNEAVSSDQRCQ